MTHVSPDDSDAAGVLRAAYANYVELKGWDAPFSYDEEQAEAFRGELGTDDLTDKNLLEIGFGEGSLLAWASDRGASVAGTEINAECLSAAREREVELLPTNLTEATHAWAGRFHYIVAFDVFEHMNLAQIVSVLTSCAALLRDDGRLLVRVPNAQSPFGLAPQFGDITHVTALSGDRLSQIAAGSPLEVVSIRGAYRGWGKGLGRKAVRLVRYLLQDVVQLFIRFMFPDQILIAPVITVVLRRRRADDIPA